jgi:hypothetical protein
MLPDEGATAAGTHFAPATKCCTYVPIIPNFLVGRVLRDEGAGVETVRARIARRSAVTPLGLSRTRAYETLYDRGGDASFGRARSMRCPHYLEEAGGSCGMWASRTAVCATWFCKHVRGATSSRFWASVRDLLARVERELAIWCLIQLDVEPAVMQHLLRESTRGPALRPDEIDDHGDPMHRELWGKWAGDEEQLFRACGDLVSPLGWDDVDRVVGPEVRSRAAVLRSSHAAYLTQSRPVRPRTAAFRVLEGDREVVRLVTYSNNDPLELPRILVEALHEFDGRPLGESLASLREERGLALEEALVSRLVDFEVLTDRA